MGPLVLGLEAQPLDHVQNPFLPGVGYVHLEDLVVPRDLVPPLKEVLPRLRDSFFELVGGGSVLAGQSEGPRRERLVVPGRLPQGEDRLLR